MMKTDYATREADDYYGIRGPALSNMPTRRLKTGPADPTGPVSSATGWFMNLFGGKTKEKGKGFEVARSGRGPPRAEPISADISLNDQPSYKDDPTAETHVQRPRKFGLEDEGDAVGAGTRRPPSDGPSPMSSDGEDEGEESDVLDDASGLGISQAPPLLPDIDAGSAFEMPGRLPSKASSRPSRGSKRAKGKESAPSVPRKSSKRKMSYGNAEDAGFDTRTRLSVISPSPPGSPGRTGVSTNMPLLLPNQRLPFGHQRCPSEAGSAVSALTEDGHDAIGGHGRHNFSGPDAYGRELREDRPSSMGFVQQHRASDGLRVIPTNEMAMSGTAAELVDDPGRPSLSSERHPSR
jgi:hypothetical protein